MIVLFYVLHKSLAVVSCVCLWSSHGLTI